MTPIEVAARRNEDKGDPWCYAPTDMLRAVACAGDLLQLHPNSDLGLLPKPIDSFSAPENWKNDIVARTLATLILTNLGVEPPLWSADEMPIAQSIEPEARTDKFWLPQLFRRTPAVTDRSAVEPEAPVPNFAMIYDHKSRSNACDEIERNIIFELLALQAQERAYKGNTIGMVDNHAMWVGRGNIALTLRPLTIDNRYPIPAGAIITLNNYNDSDEHGFRLQDVSTCKISLRRLSTLALPAAIRVAACGNTHQKISNSIPGAREAFRTISIADVRAAIDRKAAALSDQH